MEYPRDPSFRVAGGDDVSIKPPLEDEDEEPFDLNMATPKQQAIERSLPSDHGLTLQASSEAAASQLWGKSSEELISIINNMQASHTQQVSELRDQYALVSTQLEQMKGLLSSYLDSQATNTKLLQRSIASIIASQPPAVPSTSLSNEAAVANASSNAAPYRAFSTPGSVTTVGATPARGPTLTPTPDRIPTAEPPPVRTSNSPTTQNPSSARKPQSKVELRILPSLNPGEPPTVEQSSLDTVPEVWEEYRYGRCGNPSLESLDAVWGPRWRPSPKIKLWYGRQKAIVDQIRKYMADGIDEESAVMEVEKMRHGRTLHWLSRILLDDRRQTKKQWKGAQKAALAAKQAMNGDQGV